MVIEYSIVIPAYNEERTIERAIREIVRVFDDFGKSYEIIVVDDGSSDRTAEIVLRIAESAALVSLIRLTKIKEKAPRFEPELSDRQARSFYFWTRISPRILLNSKSLFLRFKKMTS